MVYTLRDFLNSCASESFESRVLILLHYAGYGKITNNDKLVFFADNVFLQSFYYDQTLNPLFSNFADILLSKVDVVTIIDACHIGIATRFFGQIKIKQAPRLSQPFKLINTLL